MPTELRIQDSFKQMTIIKLRSFEANARIPTGSEFSFKAPAGVDVVNM